MLKRGSTWFYLVVGILLLINCTPESTESPLKAEISFDNPQEALPFMLRGINLGNTLEPDEEGGWNNGPAQDSYFDDYVVAGFSCVRIPVKWGSHTLETPPYAIDPLWLIRIEQIIDWGLDRDLFIILNAHHEDWLKQDYSAANQARFDSIWTQISRHFKDKSERLLFEIINEPFGMTTEQVDDLNFRLLPLIRENNPTRIVIFSGNEWSGLGQMMQAAIPPDTNLMAYFHSYDPWDFAGEGNGIWGTEADRNGIRSMFQQASDWSHAHNIPVMVSEFGAVRACDYNSRMRHYFTYVENALEYGIAFQAWDDGGNFGILDRESHQWPEVKDILIHSSPDSPTDLALEALSESSLRLTWRIRNSQQSGIRIQRSINGSTFEQIAELAADSQSFIDTALTPGSNYYYRVLATLDAEAVSYSYPQRIGLSMTPDSRAPYHGSALVLPGVLQAEDFDLGGEGVAYHDSDPANVPNSYRPLEGVDIEARDTGGYQIAYLESGEWLEYTLQVPASRAYTLTTQVASMAGGGKFRFTAGAAYSPDITVPATQNWQTLTSVVTTLPLIAGEHILRLEIISVQPFNVDRIVIE